MSTNDPEFYQAPKFTPEPPPALPQPARLFLLWLHHRQHSGFAHGDPGVSRGLLCLPLRGSTGRRLYTATAPQELPKVEMPADSVRRSRTGSRRSARPSSRNADRTPGTDQRRPQCPDRGKRRLQGQDSTSRSREMRSRAGQHPARPSAKSRSLRMFRGRYLNGEADFKASLQDGVLIVTLDSFEVNGKKAPEEFMTDCASRTWPRMPTRTRSNAEMIRKLESLEVKDGKIILKVRAKRRRTSQIRRPPRGKLPVEVVAPAQRTKSRQPRRLNLRKTTRIKDQARTRCCRGQQRPRLDRQRHDAYAHLSPNLTHLLEE